jgi:hypothetical protein
MSLDDSTYGFENGFDLNFKHGRMCAVLAAVSGYNIGSAENNVLRIPAIRRLGRRCGAARVAIWAVSRRICWSEEGYDGRAQRNG